MAVSFLLLMMETNAWRRRRRRRRYCQAINCLVSGWTSWRSCSHPCAVLAVHRDGRGSRRGLRLVFETMKIKIKKVFGSFYSGVKTCSMWMKVTPNWIECPYEQENKACTFCYVLILYPKIRFHFLDALGKKWDACQKNLVKLCLKYSLKKIDCFNSIVDGESLYFGIFVN